MIEYNKLYNITKNLKVLYIEDDKNFQKETCELLNYFFINIDLAYDGKDGLNKYINHFKTYSSYYDIVITDINMPKMNGIELSKAIYKYNETQPIVVISAHDETHYLLELINIGIEQFLQKPIIYNKVLEVIHNISIKISKVSDINSENTNILKLDKNYYWDKEKLLLFYDNHNIKLTKKETLLLELFIKNNTKISTNEEIINTLWKDKEHLVSDDSLMPLISRFRKKLPNHTIENIYGLGYRLNL